MKALTDFPIALAARVQAKDHVPVSCDCGITFGWHVSKGEIATCPSCGVSDQIPLNPVTPPEMKSF